ncbi:hypothetical protein [Streptomyces sp. ICBB 8177]|uniref:hypothetical protein n=1 Tax=Streptomyces sp. ICBB 8177 TaxID=563922 RepID=UPI001F54516B|nr:hypothetical protein [Streptomyces sp. ICBB 8177]
MRGRIVLSNDRDYVGIIESDDGLARPFSGMETQTIREGQRVSFDTVGAKATNVAPVARVRPH